MYVYILYIVVYRVYINGLKGATARRVLKSHKRKMGVIYMPHWLCGNSFTWAHDVQSHCGDSCEGTLYIYIYIYMQARN